MLGSDWLGAIHVLIVVGIVVLICAAYLGERVLKARRGARHREQMASRLAAAAVRAEEQEAKRQRSVTAGAALTSVMPAINRPPDTMEDVARRNGMVRALTQHGERNNGHQRGHGRQHNTGTAHRTGPQRGTGPQRRDR
ncbi:MAG TPA: hypothetical protein VE343_05415, partial [Streptosporangiaceae bacterium]|nr:hypothetical protein [Streptosporangiaceae bacterium]